MWVSALLLPCELLNAPALFFGVVLLPRSLLLSLLSSLHKYLLTFYPVPSIVLGLGDGTINKTNSRPPSGGGITVGETDSELGDTYVF